MSEKKQNSSADHENEEPHGNYYYTSSESSCSETFSDICSIKEFEEDFEPSESEEISDEETEEVQEDLAIPSSTENPEPIYNSSSEESSSESMSFEDDFEPSEEESETEESEKVKASEPLDIKSIFPWSTTGQLKKIDFIKENKFFGNPEPTPTAYFNFFVEDGFLAMICDKTNAKAQSALSQKLAGDSGMSVWEELKIPELRIFLGLLFHLGIVRGPFHYYWKRDMLINMPIFRRNMKRDRFLMIMKFLHFSSLTESNDLLHKIRPVMDYFNNKMNSCYYPNKDLVLDSIVLWKGLWLYEIKERQKGIKLDMLTEPGGVILKFGVAYSQDTVGRKKTERVLQLLKEKLQNGHAVYTDFEYSSFGLAKRLLENNTYCTGLLSKDKRIFRKLLKKVSAKDDVSLFQDNVHIGKFGGDANLMYITTEFEEKNVTVTSKRGNVSVRPEAVARYIQLVSMTRYEDLLGSVPCEGLVFRWHLKLGIQILHMLMFNAYKMYAKYAGQPRIDFGDYRLAVIENLLKKPASDVPSTL